MGIYTLDNTENEHATATYMNMNESQVTQENKQHDSNLHKVLNIGEIFFKLHLGPHNEWLKKKNRKKKLKSKRMIIIKFETGYHWESGNTINEKGNKECFFSMCKYFIS